MTVAISSREDIIFLPEKLMILLKLREGDAIKVIIEGQTLHRHWPVDCLFERA